MISEFFGFARQPELRLERLGAVIQATILAVRCIHATGLRRSRAMELWSIDQNRH
jgi:hypothetical protein